MMYPKRNDGKMKDETKHVQMNEAMWDKWAEEDTLDNNGRNSKFLRADQKKVISLLNVQDECPSSRHRLRDGLGGRSSGEFGERQRFVLWR